MRWIPPQLQGAAEWELKLMLFTALLAMFTVGLSVGRMLPCGHKQMRPGEITRGHTWYVSTAESRLSGEGLPVAVGWRKMDFAQEKERIESFDKPYTLRQQHLAILRLKREWTLAKNLEEQQRILFFVWCLQRGLQYRQTNWAQQQSMNELRYRFGAETAFGIDKD